MWIWGRAEEAGEVRDGDAGDAGVGGGGGGKPRPARASWSIAMTRGRTSLQEVMGGAIGISYVVVLSLSDAIVRLE